MLDVDNAAPFLISNGLLDVTAVVDGQLVVSSVARRNRNLRVETTIGKGYLIKQPESVSTGGHHTLQHEAAFYALCHDRLASTPITALLPRLAHVDHTLPILVLELLHTGIPLWRCLLASPDASGGIARALGRATGVIHSCFRSFSFADAPGLAELTSEPPRALFIHSPTLDWLSVISPAAYEILRILQSRKRLVRKLDKLAELWRPTTLIHGDVKLDNVLVVSPVGNTGEPQLRVVDWELVQRGDPAWDIAGALADIVRLWTETPAEDAPSDQPRLPVETRHPWPLMQSVFRSFWRGYRDEAQNSGDDNNTLLSRAVRFSSARLIQSAMEGAQDADRLPVHAALLVQIASNILDNPASAQMQFYGIPQVLEI